MNAVKNEKGIALVLALVMLALLTVLGAYALSTSSTELFIAGNYRNSQLAFYGADAGEEYGQKDGAIYTAIVPVTSPVWPVHGEGNGVTSPDYNLVPVGNATADVKVTYIMTGELPPGSGYDSEWKANYFIVNSIGMGPVNSRVDVEKMVCRPVPPGS